LNLLVNPKELFSHYVWVTGTSSAAQEYSYSFRDKILKYLPECRSVLEIASNDGTFLKPFIDLGMEVLGVDPAQNIVDIANEEGVRTICEFFSSSEAEKIVSKYCKEGFDAVIARNVIAHTPNPVDMLKGISQCLSEKGLAFVEYHDALHIMKEFQYDSIYHEHYSYFHLNSFMKAAMLADLKVVDHFRSPISGGASVIVIAKQNSTVDMSLSIEEKLHLDRVVGVDSEETWLQFSQKAILHSKQLYEQIDSQSQLGDVYCYGSSARSNTMLAFAGIDKRQIKLIVDNNPLKQNKFTPGSGIPIKSKEYLPKSNAFLVLLAWNFSSEITKKLIEDGYRNITVLQPLPEAIRSYKIG